MGSRNSNDRAKSDSGADAIPFSNVDWPSLLAAAVIAAAAIIVYCNSFAGVMVFDDSNWIEMNKSIRSLWPLNSLFAPPNGGTVGGRPVLSLTLALNYQFGGLNVWGYHAVNLAIHILAAWTLFGIVRRTLLLPLLRNRFGAAAVPLALAIALIWTVHPLQTAAVTYIIQRTESLVSLFFLLTLYCVIRGGSRVESGEWRVESEQPDTGGTSGTRLSVPFLTPHASSLTPIWYTAAVACCALGMATKEVMAGAPLVVLLYDRTFLSGSFRRALAERWGLYLALAASWGIIAWVLIGTDFHGGTTGFAAKRFTWQAYLLTQPGVLAHYLRMAFWPVGLCFDYRWPAAEWPAEVVAPGLLIVALLALTGWALVKRPAIGFLGACFFLVLAPSSSIVPLNDAAFDHRMYLPLAAIVTGVVLGVFALAGAVFGAEHDADERAIPVKLSIALPAVLLVAATAALGFGTFLRNYDYRSRTAIWQDTVAKRPGNARAPYSLGLALEEEGKLDESIAANEAALVIDPLYADAHTNLGVLLLLRANGESSAARAQARTVAAAHLRLALKLNPTNASANHALATVLADEDRMEEAVHYFHAASEADPNDPAIHNDFGLALQHHHQFDAAIREFEAAIKIEPDYAFAHDSCGILLASLGQYDKAVRHGQKAVKLMPGVGSFHFNLGRSLFLEGRYEEGVPEMQLGIKLAAAQAGEAAARRGQDAAPAAEAAAKPLRAELDNYQAQLQRIRAMQREAVPETDR